MKRFHVHVAVKDLESNIRFYSALFGAEPTVTKADYAKWMVEGDEEAKRKAFLSAFTTLRRSMELFLSMPHGKIDKLALSQRLSAIGKS